MHPLSLRALRVEDEMASCPGRVAIHPEGCIGTEGDQQVPRTCQRDERRIRRQFGTQILHTGLPRKTSAEANTLPPQIIRRHDQHQLVGTALDQQRPQISESMRRTVFQHHPARIKVRGHCVRIHRPAITGRDVAEADGGVIQNQNVRFRQSLWMSLSEPFHVSRGFRSAVAQGIRHTPDLPLPVRRRKRLPMRERMVLSRQRDWVFKRDAADHPASGDPAGAG